jgi:hypothetical protein
VNSEECEVVSSSGVRFSRGVLNHSSADASIGALCHRNWKTVTAKNRGVAPAQLISCTVSFNPGCFMYSGIEEGRVGGLQTEK